MTRFVATAVGYVELTEDEDGINAAVLVLAEKEKGLFPGGSAFPARAAG
ncbi:MAG: hypothetical protein AB7K71_18310 [Polyangiaceae bacterium]